MTVPATTQIALAKAAPVAPSWFARLSRKLGGSGMVASAILLVIALAALLAPWIAPYPPNQPDLLAALSGPSAAHPLGADALGRDILSRAMWGARITLAGPTLVILIATVAGTVLALVAAWCGGKIDTVISWFLDILFSVPGIVFGLIAVAIFGPNLMTVVIGLSIGFVPYVARVVRGAALRERNMPYVQAAWLQGQSGVSITLKQILPNVQPIIVAQAVSSLGFAVIDLAAVSFLGLGVQPPTADLGLMVKSGFDSLLRGQPTEAIVAGAGIVLIVWCITAIGDKLASNVRTY
ncbi:MULTISPECIES: ABC transporter permease [unclassified Leucobacter]|uniref:ABC transporter permease n=1 Tax=unclassified Leucobacter TaxID=2621730 RepID=UPI00165D6506|nr:MULTISPECIES: ABC transporter permease [unclassified Leucobacter]MBC9926171.1 ABC transporter permease [Leucobacter sp. cx-169]MBC9935846.1 ABC transporter permease [Leucobacter sp. cx-87]